MRCGTSRPGRWPSSWSISLGAADKPLLLGGTAVFVLGICGYAASLMRRHPLLPDLVFFALTLIGLAAILRLPRPGIGAGLALMIGLVTWIVTLRVITPPLLGEVPATRPPTCAAVTS